MATGDEVQLLLNRIASELKKQTPSDKSLNAEELKIYKMAIKDSVASVNSLRDKVIDNAVFLKSLGIKI